MSKNNKVIHFLHKRYITLCNNVRTLKVWVTREPSAVTCTACAAKIHSLGLDL